LKNYEKIDDGSFPFPIALSIPKDSEGYPKIESCLSRLFSSYYPTYDVSKAF